MTNNETYDDDEENGSPRSSFSTYLAEGATLFKQGEIKKAIESFSLALEVQPNDKTCLVARSKCYLKLGDPQKALEDAEAVLNENKDCIKGLCRKAEALYCMGDFEYALVYYHRGHKLRPELDEFRLGIQKAQEAIDNSIGSAAKIKLEAKGDLSFFAKQDDLGTKKRGYSKPAPVIKLKPAIANRNKDVKIAAPSKKTVKQLLGELYADKEYLERLMDDDHFLKNNTKSPIYELVQSGLNFLETRTEFWRQQRPIYARKKETRKLKSTAKKKTKSDFGKYVLHQLEDIDQALNNADPERGLRLARNLLKFTKEVDEKELPHKTEVTANIHSCIGNALIDLEQLPKALKHHQRDLQICMKNKSDHIGISRALGNIGRVNARLGRFKDAIQNWEEKIQYIKTPLEATWLYHELGRCYLELNSLEAAISYGMKSLVAAKEGNDEVWQLNANVLIAQANGNLTEFDKSIAAFEEALSLAVVMADEIAETAVTKALFEIKRKAEIHGRLCSEDAYQSVNSDKAKDELEEPISSVRAESFDENLLDAGELNLSNDSKYLLDSNFESEGETDQRGLDHVTKNSDSDSGAIEQLEEVDYFYDPPHQDDLINDCENLDEDNGKKAPTDEKFNNGQEASLYSIDDVARMTNLNENKGLSEEPLLALDVNEQVEVFKEKPDAFSEAEKKLAEESFCFTETNEAQNENNLAEETGCFAETNEEQNENNLAEETGCFAETNEAQNENNLEEETGCFAEMNEAQNEKNLAEDTGCFAETDTQDDKSRNDVNAKEYEVSSYHDQLGAKDVESKRFNFVGIEERDVRKNDKICDETFTLEYSLNKFKQTDILSTVVQADDNLNLSNHALNTKYTPEILNESNPGLITGKSSGEEARFLSEEEKLEHFFEKEADEAEDEINRNETELEKTNSATLIVTLGEMSEKEQSKTEDCVETHAENLIDETVTNGTPDEIDNFENSGDFKTNQSLKKYGTNTSSEIEEQVLDLFDKSENLVQNEKAITESSVTFSGKNISTTSEVCDDGPKKEDNSEDSPFDVQETRAASPLVEKIEEKLNGDGDALEHSANSIIPPTIAAVNESGEE